MHAKEKETLSLLVVAVVRVQYTSVVKIKHRAGLEMTVEISQQRIRIESNYIIFSPPSQVSYRISSIISFGSLLEVVFMLQVNL